MKKSFLLPLVATVLASNQACVASGSHSVGTLEALPLDGKEYSITGYLAYQRESISIFGNDELARLSAEDICHHLTNLSEFSEPEEAHGRLARLTVIRVPNPHEGRIVPLTCVNSSVRILHLEFLDGI